MNRYADITDLRETAILDVAAARTAYFCEQCGKCGSVCPAVYKKPNPTSLIRLVQLGRVKEALHSPLLWSCIGCEQCNMVCPNKLDPARVVRCLRRLSAREKDVCFPKYILDFLLG
ncbi:MAG: 4Fe-4S dicluster domain-containing protein [Bacillota bacterium]